MAGNVNHQYHILEPDIWPFVGSLSALVFTSGMVLYMHDMANGHLVLGLGIAGLIATFFSWFSNIVKEAERGDQQAQHESRHGAWGILSSPVGSIGRAAWGMA